MHRLDKATPACGQGHHTKPGEAGDPLHVVLPLGAVDHRGVEEDARGAKRPESLLEREHAPRPLVGEARVAPRRAQENEMRIGWAKSVE